MDLPQVAKEKLISLGAGLADSFLVAVSGGTDSTALLLAVRESLGDTGTLTAAHLDHGVHTGSARAMKKVLELCEKFGVKVVTDRLDPVELDARRSAFGSLEAGMRDLRYRFLFREAGKAGSKWILTGHTADDQAETVLFRVCRGMDWRSFGGIPDRRGKVLRPLIDVHRSATRSHCEALGVRPVTDPTNYDDSYERNRIRNRVLPALAAGFSPDVSGLLGRMGRAALSLSKTQSILMEKSLRGSADGMTDILTRDAVMTLPVVLRDRSIVDYLKRILGEYPSARLVDDVLRFVMAGRNGQLSLPGRLNLVLSYGKLFTADDSQSRREALPSEELELKVPGRLHIPSAGISITTQKTTLKAPGTFPSGRTALLAGRSVTETLWVRKRLPGDCFMPLGMKNHRKLKDFFIDRKVPRAIRDLTPIVLNQDGEILWVGGMEISQAAALKGEEGEKAILIRIDDLAKRDLDTQKQLKDKNDSGG